MNVVIVEDEVLVSRRLQRMTADVLGPESENIEIATNLGDAIIISKKFSNAVVLLDLNLSGQDGFDLIRRAVVEPFQTIVVSANIDRAIEAFELGVVDFIPKPFTRERLQRALERVKETMAGIQDSKLAVVGAGAIDLVSILSIVAIHGDGDYAKIETMDGKSYLHNKTLSTLQDLLPKNFVRVHRSHIVNLHHAIRIVKNSNGQTLQLANNSGVPIGRSYLHKLKQEFIN